MWGSLQALPLVLGWHFLSIYLIFSIVFAADSQVLVFKALLRLHAPFSRCAFPLISTPETNFNQFKYINSIEQLFSQAFDIFSEVQRRLQMRVDAALDWDTPNWQMKYACPTCGFKVLFRHIS